MKTLKVDTKFNAHRNKFKTFRNKFILLYYFKHSNKCLCIHHTNLRTAKTDKNIVGAWKIKNPKN